MLEHFLAGLSSLFVFACLLNLAWAIIASMTADSKGYSGGVWFLCALLFGPLSVLQIAIMQTRRPLPTSSSIPWTTTPTAMERAQ